MAQDPMRSWNKIDEFEVVDFESAISVVNTDYEAYGEVTEAVALTIPQGSPYQVYDAKFKAEGYNGVNSRLRWFDSNINPDIYSQIDFSATYNNITVVFETEYRKDFQDIGKAPKSATIFTVDGSAQDDDTSGFVDILNGWFSSVLGFDAITW